MNRHWLSIAAGLLAMVMTAWWAPAARAADPEFCSDYARTAEAQVRAAHNSDRCRWAIDQNPARWTGDYGQHYGWCLGASYGNANAEREARRDALDHCAAYSRGDFCSDYAQKAVRESWEARQHGSCHWAVDRDPARWTTDYDAHYSWCMGVSQEAAEQERNARHATLDRCVDDYYHGW